VYVSSAQFLGASVVGCLSLAVVDDLGGEQADACVAMPALYQRKKSWQNALAFSIEAKRSGKPYRYLMVLNWGSGEQWNSEPT